MMGWHRQGRRLALLAFAVAAAIGLLAASPSPAAADSFTISGVVRDSGSAPVSGATISAYSGGSGALCCTWVIAARSDDSGSYSLTVPSGTYRLQFYPPDGSTFQTQWWAGSSA